MYLAIYLHRPWLLRPGAPPAKFAGGSFSRVFLRAYFYSLANYFGPACFMARGVRFWCSGWAGRMIGAVLGAAGPGLAGGLPVDDEHRNILELFLF